MKEHLLKEIIQYLLVERDYNLKIPTSYQELKQLYKALVNTRFPIPLSETILNKEDQYLKLEQLEKEITDVNNLLEIEPHIILWQGDITTLKCDCIVNAGNEDGLGCFNPQHLCIDNVIHTAAGMRLRLECQNILQGQKIKTGDFIVCNAYNLPCQKIITTVGPQIITEPTLEDELALSNCYKNTLEYAIKNNYHSIAFPCISTGLFAYPIAQAKLIAYKAVKETLNKYQSNIKVIFNVFSGSDYDEYQKMFTNKKIN